MITINNAFVPKESVVARKVGEDMILLDLESGQYFGLDAVGARIWQLIENEQESLAAISAIIHSEYDASQSQIETDLVALATQLLERDLIETV